MTVLRGQKHRVVVVVAGIDSLSSESPPLFEQKRVDDADRPIKKKVLLKISSKRRALTISRRAGCVCKKKMINTFQEFIDDSEDDSANMFQEFIDDSDEDDHAGDTAVATEAKERLDALEKSLSGDDHSSARDSIESDPSARDLLARLRANKESLWFLSRVGDYPNAIESLLVGGANPNEMDGRGETPLHVAAAEGRVGTVRVLLARPDVDPNKTAVDGKTSLHVAAERGHVDVVTCLTRDDRTNRNARDRARKTPLHVVAETGDRATAYALLENGPDVNVDAMSDSRETPVSIAEGRGDAAMATTLREYRTEEENLRDHLRRIENEKTKELEQKKTAAIARVRRQIHEAHAARVHGVEFDEASKKRRKRRDEAVARVTDIITKKHSEALSRVIQDIRATCRRIDDDLKKKRKKREEEERLWCVSEDELQ